MLSNNTKAEESEPGLQLTVPNKKKRCVYAI